MGETLIQVKASQTNNEADLTDDDIQKLLLEAEGRLRTDIMTPADSLALDDTVDHASLNIPKLSSGTTLQPYVQQQDDVAIADRERIISPLQKDLSNGLRLLEANALQKSKSKMDKPTAGADWFNLPKTELTTEFKRDLQLIRMRSVLDPKRHYKKESGKAQPPEYSQIGTIIEGPTEFFSGRIAKKDRKKTFVEEVLAVERKNKRFESKYRDIQATKQSGKKAYYKSLQAKRKSKAR